EQATQRLLVAANEPRDRRVIRNQIGRDHPICNVLATVTLDPARGTLTRGIRVQDQRDHHPWVIRRPAMPVLAIRPIEALKIQLLDDLDHKPRQMILRQPIPHIRRQQIPLLTITINEVLGHPGIPLTGPDGTPFTRQPHAGAQVAANIRTMSALLSERKAARGRFGAAVRATDAGGPASRLYPLARGLLFRSSEVIEVVGVVGILACTSECTYHQTVGGTRDAARIKQPR